jgi:hypothetical protein
VDVAQYTAPPPAGVAWVELGLGLGFLAWAMRREYEPLALLGTFLYIAYAYFTSQGFLRIATTGGSADVPEAWAALRNGFGASAPRR